MNEALGMLEVYGFVAAVEVGDIMAKAANIRLGSMKRTRENGWMTVIIYGDVGAVKAGIEAGEQAAKGKGAYISSKVIPRPIDDIFSRDTDQPMPWEGMNDLTENTTDKEMEPNQIKSAPAKSASLVKNDKVVKTKDKSKTATAKSKTTKTTKSKQKRTDQEQNKTEQANEMKDSADKENVKKPNSKQVSKKEADSKQGGTQKDQSKKASKKQKNTDNEE
ncbi:BMC domain-containing protein [Amphibacillus sp. Q70]|uniref:BMC domain-containing protein n=1 Tax=Amphibacillus sp. Q70 TaxID=3453416 RepID=UPI003F8342B0